MSKYEATEIGKRILQRLDELNMSKLQLSQKSGIARSTIHLYLYNDTDIPLSRIKTLGEVLECEPAWLIGYGENTKYITLSIKSACTRVVKEINSLPIETFKDVEPTLLSVVRLTKKLSSKEETEPESS